MHARTVFNDVVNQPNIICALNYANLYLNVVARRGGAALGNQKVWGSTPSQGAALCLLISHSFGPGHHHSNTCSELGLYHVQMLLQLVQASKDYLSHVLNHLIKEIILTELR